MKNTLTIILALGVIGVISANAADAKENFEKICAKCHGADGTGKTKMGEKLKVRDYTNTAVQASLKDEEMTKAIKEGVKEGDATKMKAYGDVLSDNEIKALAAYVRAFKK